MLEERGLPPVLDLIHYLDEQSIKWQRDAKQNEDLLQDVIKMDLGDNAN